jgi:hypothetical protein
MSTPPANRFVALGCTGAVVATIFGGALAPDQPQSPISVLVRAGLYILVVFGATACATYLGFLIGDRRTERARQLALRTAATTVWLPPLLLFSEQKSVFVLVIWIALLIEVARLIAFVKKSAMFDDGDASPREPPEICAFSVLKQDFPSGITILGALMIQGAAFAAFDGRDVLAGVLYVTGTTAIAYRVLRMFQDTPALDGPRLKERLPSTLLTATFLIVFAWLPLIIGSGGPGPAGDSIGALASSGRPTPAQSSQGAGARNEKRGPHGGASALAWLQVLFKPAGTDSHASSFAAARLILDSTFPQSHGTSHALTKNLQNTKIATAVFVAGPVFAGVELYPEVKPHTRLVAPPLEGIKGFGADRSDPLSIPFEGVYWFWRGPSDRPPLNSVVMHGSPSTQFFRSTDGDGMSMEARQNLGFAVDPKRYGAIEIFIQNVDPFPNSVSILLKVRNTTVAGNPILSLGMQDVSTPVSAVGSNRSGMQMLRFRIPSDIRIGSFDELTVSYYLKGARSDRSARIAINGFRLVPRGG